MSKGARLLSAIVGLLAVIATVGFTAAAGSARTHATGKSDSGTAWVAETQKPGNLLYTAGYDQDKVLGAGAILYEIKATPTKNGTIKVAAKTVTLYTATGSLTGTATATLTANTKTGKESVTGGKLNLGKGAGSLKGHSLTATFTGTGSLKTLTFTFHYTGTYK
jgi:hypothetical protein